MLERGPAPAARWRERYDRLRINASALTAHLPGRRFPLSYGRWPSRDELVAYYEYYARRHRLELACGVQVDRIDRVDGSWRLSSSAGEINAAAVVVATCKDAHPVVPAWPGLESFAGRVVHVGDYRNARPYAGRRGPRSTARRRPSGD